MLGRRLLVLLAILVGLGAFAAAVAPRDGGFQPTLPPPAGTQPQPSPDEPPPAPAPQASTDPGESSTGEDAPGSQRPQATGREPAQEPGGSTSGGEPQTAVGGKVDAVLPPAEGASSTIRVRSGDHVRLSVHADRPTTVSIEGRTEIQPAEPATPARFSFIAAKPGRYPVMRADSTEPVGELVVTES